YEVSFALQNQAWAYEASFALQNFKEEESVENCSIVTRPALNLVGISYSGSYSSFPDEAIRLQTEILTRKHELNGAEKSPVLYFPYFGNEAFETYWACYEVQHLEVLPEGIVQFTIPEYRYAMAGCSNKRIGEGYEQLHAW